MASSPEEGDALSRVSTDRSEFRLPRSTFTGACIGEPPAAGDTLHLHDPTRRVVIIPRLFVSPHSQGTTLAN